MSFAYGTVVIAGSFAAFVTVVACTEQSSQGDGAAGAADASLSQGVDGASGAVDADASASYSFDPSRYPTDCAVDADCAVVHSVRSCDTGCQVPVRAGQASIDLAAVTSACRDYPGGHGQQPGCRPAARPACAERRCINCDDAQLSTPEGDPPKPGVVVALGWSGHGAWVIEATVDGVKTKCEVSLPPSPPGPSFRCDPGAELRFVGYELGGMLGGDGRPIPGSMGFGSMHSLVLTTTTAVSITVSASLNGTVFSEKTFAPVYGGPPPAPTPSVNGPPNNPPGCEAAWSQTARLSF